MPIASVQDALREGLSHHQSGRLQQAERIYRDVLATDQNCAPAWYLLGALAHHAGHSEAAAQMIERAIRLGLKNCETYNNLGECYRCLGKHQEASDAYQASLQLNPNHAETLNNFGLLFNNLGRFPDAIPMLEKALILNPNLPAAHYNYGVTLAGLGRVDDSIKAWQAAVQLNPEYLLALKDLGITLQARGRVDEAVGVLRRLVERYPDFAEGHADYADALSAANMHEEAIREAKRALEFVPNRPDFHNTLGIVYYRAGRFEEALQATLKAVELDPNFVPAIDNIGNIYDKMENYVEAARWFERVLSIDPANLSTCKGLFTAYFKTNRCVEALELAERVLRHEPNHPRVHFDRGMILLAMGRYIEGFEEYEWRVRCKGFQYLSRSFQQPLWDGSDQPGRTLLVYGEQGFGDIIQFIRYVPLVLQKGLKIIAEVSPPLCPIIESIPGITKVVPFGSLLPEFDLHSPLLSLPRIFKTTVETIPQQVPYLFPDKARIDRIRSSVAMHARGLKVGLVWGGNERVDPKRSTSIKSLSVLSDMPNVSWFSLQTDEHREKLKDAPPEMNILDLGRGVNDFADTAAIMSEMDLIITIDTASAHLAGALGMKTWTLIPFVPDWRWFLTGDTTPWYPTMRLFRQEQPNDWAPTIAQIKNELLQLVGDGKGMT